MKKFQKSLEVELKHFTQIFTEIKWNCLLEN